MMFNPVFIIGMNAVVQSTLARQRAEESLRAQEALQEEVTSLRESKRQVERPSRAKQRPQPTTGFGQQFHAEKPLEATRYRRRPSPAATDVAPSAQADTKDTSGKLSLSRTKTAITEIIPEGVQVTWDAPFSLSRKTRHYVVSFGLDGGPLQRLGTYATPSAVIGNPNLKKSGLYVVQVESGGFTARGIFTWSRPKASGSTER